MLNKLHGGSRMLGATALAAILALLTGCGDNPRTSNRTYHYSTNHSPTAIPNSPAPAKDVIVEERRTVERPIDVTADTEVPAQRIDEKIETPINVTADQPKEESSETRPTSSNPTPTEYNANDTATVPASTPDQTAPEPLPLPADPTPGEDVNQKVEPSDGPSGESVQ